jgi:hypothetical protein
MEEKKIADKPATNPKVPPKGPPPPVVAAKAEAAQVVKHGPKPGLKPGQTRNGAHLAKLLEADAALKKAHAAIQQAANVLTAAGYTHVAKQLRTTHEHLVGISGVTHTLASFMRRVKG